LAEAQGRLDTRLAEAEQRIAASREEAMGEIETVAAEAAQDIVQRLAGIKVTRPAANKAVKEAMIHG
ncbi:MAG: ATPase, partial [Pseudomonadota bacterium]|nr:ATPase [Pseudomonadota bacterium]